MYLTVREAGKPEVTALEDQCLGRSLHLMDSNFSCSHTWQKR